MSRPNRLFRQDGRNLVNMANASFHRWHDRAIAAVILLIAMAAIRSWFADQPVAVATWAAAAIGGAVGIGVGRSIAGRLTFHATDGMLAADALHLVSRRGYSLRWHGIALLPLSFTMLVARPALLGIALASYAAGALVAPVTAIPRRRGSGRWMRWTMRHIAGRGLAGIAIAGILLLLSMLARSLGEPTRWVVIGGMALGATGILTIVDHAVVGFMTIAGDTTGRVVARHLHATTGFAAVAIPGSAFVAGPVAASIVAACVAATALLLVVRILAYRLYRKRLADLLVTIMIAILLTVGLTMPVVLPVVAIAMLWQFQRRAGRQTWLIP